MTTSINTMLKNRKNRKNKKGFSLVELIVVLVIMAILAAALVPTLIGYINQTRQSNAKNEAAGCVSAAQTIVSSAYASPDGKYVNKTSGGTDVTIGTDFSTEYVFSEADMVVVEKLAEVTSGSATTGVTEVKTQNGVITSLKYTADNGEKVIYTATPGSKGSYSMGS